MLNRLNIETINGRAYANGYDIEKLIMNNLKSNKNIINIEKARLTEFLDYLLDKTKGCYKTEVEIMTGRFLKALESIKR